MKKTTKKIIINSGIYEKRIAVLYNNKLDDFFVEQGGADNMLGNIYKGIIETVVPGIGAAFVNIGEVKNGFLFLEDAEQRVSEMFDNEGFDIEKKNKKKKNIRDIIKAGQELLVQVEKEPIGTKGPRLTTALSIPGRHIVLTPFDESLGISKKISDRKERQRIRDIVESIKMPKGIGCIIRTAAQGKEEKEFKREMKYLLDLWKKIKNRSSKCKAPESLYQEYGLVLRIVRDEVTEDVEKVIVDSKEEYKNIIRFINHFMPELKKKIEFYKDKNFIFDKYGVEKEIERIFRKKILLKSGGSIVIEQTEGMVAIDVNTERFTGKKNAEDTIFKTNIEAAREIGRQIRLRDIGGIIIIDFIDMRTRENKEAVHRELENCLKKDKAKTRILSISPIGVVEMTRQRARKSLEHSMFQECPCCHGKGLVKSIKTVSIEALRKIEKMASASKDRNIDVWVSPELFDYFRENEKTLVVPLTKKCRKNFNFNIDDAMNNEEVMVI